MKCVIIVSTQMQSKSLSLHTNNQICYGLDAPPTSSVGALKANIIIPLKSNS